MRSHDNPGPIAVVKIGGSLLTWPELPKRLEAFLSREEGGGRRVVLIVGGGSAADLVRTLDATHGLGDEAAHRLALRALDFTAELLAGLLPSSRVARRLDELPTIQRSGLRPVLAPRLHLEKEDERRPDRLPFSWNVTTDSIAARIAETLGGGRLILLKSASAAVGMSRVEAARSGLVDSFFPEAARALERVEIVNLRDGSMESRPLVD